MTKLSMGLVVALSLVAGCKKKGSSTDEAMGKMADFAKTMCECKDKACADKVNNDMTAWGTEMAKGAAKDEKPDPEMAKKSADVMSKYVDCMTKLVVGGAKDVVGETTMPKLADPKPVAGKSCEDQGGKKVGDNCELKIAAPIDVAFSGKYDTDAMHPEPGAVFKVTNKLDVPVTVGTLKIYAYDKAGTQLELDAGGSKVKYAEVSKMNLIELGPKESKDYVSSLDKKMGANADALQLEVTSWTADKVSYSRAVGDSMGGDAFEKRPKDGWK